MCFDILLKLSRKGIPENHQPACSNKLLLVSASATSSDLGVRGDGKVLKLEVARPNVSGQNHGLALGLP